MLLPESIISLVESNKISAGHARALLAISDTKKQKEVALLIVEKGLTVRDVEQIIKNMNRPVVERPVQEKSLELKDFENSIKRVFATKVQIKGNDNKGKIVIDYYSKDDLNRIYDILNKQ